MIKTKTKTLGVIGGLGPMATAYYMELVIQMTDASCDQEHLNMIISSRPGTPDRTRYILGLSDENPAPVMIDAGRWLVAEGAEILAIPCITAHYFQKQLEEERQSLVRVNDIIAELEKQKGPLEKQSETAKVYLQKKEGG